MSDLVTEQQKRFRLGDVIGGFIAATILANLCMGIATKAGATDSGIFAASMGGFWIGLLASVLFASHKRATGSLGTDVWFSLKKGDVLPGLAIGIACQLVLVSAIYAVLGIFFDVSSLDDVANDLINNYGQGWHIYPLMFGLVIVSPLIEELFYRGQLLRTLSQWLSPRLAASISAVIFAMLHFHPVQIFGLFVFAYILAELARRTQRLGLGVFAHIGFNAAAFATILLS